LATGARSDVEPVILNPASRTEAVRTVRDIVTPFARGEDAGRVLVCFDFAYGYPRGLGSALAGTSAPWRRVWSRIAALVHDDIGTKAGRPPSNRSNRFDAADRINEDLSPPGGPIGPFWCLFEPGSRRSVPQEQPARPFALRGGGTLGAHRLTDVRAQADTPFRLFGNGSVGSQVLTGLPCLERHRFDAALAGVSSVWPFETGWAATERWLPDGVRIVHAEIYPSVRPPLPDPIKDRGQVRAMWHWARDLDTAGTLVDAFAIPAGIVAGSQEDVAVRAEEGWILGCPSSVKLDPQPTPPRRRRSAGVARDGEPGELLTRAYGAAVRGARAGERRNLDVGSGGDRAAVGTRSVIRRLASCDPPPVSWTPPKARRCARSCSWRKGKEGSSRRSSRPTQ
jgi:hypothetical protein